MNIQPVILIVFGFMLASLLTTPRRNANYITAIYNNSSSELFDCLAKDYLSPQYLPSNLLCETVMMKSPEMTSMLVNNGLNVNQMCIHDIYGMESVTSLALRYQCLECAKILLDAGADPRTIGQKGQMSTEMLILSQGHLDLWNYLTPHTRYGNTLKVIGYSPEYIGDAMYYGLITNQTKVIQRLLKLNTPFDTAIDCQLIHYYHMNYLEDLCKKS